MSRKTLQTFFDCGFSKVRAGTFNINNNDEAFFAESDFFIDRSNLELKIQKIITSLEKDSNEYIDNINLMVDSSKMLSVGISLSKKLDGSKLKQANIQFLVQEAKQQILKYYTSYNIVHIIINNYKIDDVDYSYLPDEIKSNFISLDIIFICLPTDLVLYLKNIFSKSNIFVDQIICSSYVKSINYKDNLNLSGHVSFIDVGFIKTSVISYFNDKILSLDVLPIGGNHITKDISQILEIDLEASEQAKRNFDQNLKLSNYEGVSIETLQKIIFARTEEILELCAKSIESNSYTVAVQNYTITIGAGAGPGISTQLSTSGSNTVALGSTAIGGGGGSTSTNNSYTQHAGLSGGSGGGGAHYHVTGAPGAGTAGQGNSGGVANGYSGAGGGKGAVGGAGNAQYNGAGGVGLNWKSLGTYYAGGGGAENGLGGLGGGGRGISVTGQPAHPNGESGAANTGGGGGTCWGYVSHNGGAGGSGIVIIRYAV